MADIIVVAVLITIIGGVLLYIYKAKKRGDACIGCPHAKACGGKCHGGCSTDKEE